MSTEIQFNGSLKALSTFQLEARARELAILETPSDLPALLDTDLEVMILGQGSNTLFLDDFQGRLILNRIGGIDSEVLDFDHVRVTAGAGEDWHGLVRWSLERGLWGLENLALIPGSVGAGPIQNIGAYGVELAHCLEAVEVLDRHNGAIEWLAAADCDFGYRSSRFKQADADRFVILNVILELEQHGTAVYDYPSLIAELDAHGIRQPDARQVAAAVMRIRRRKLPNPDTLANAGSFFRNPVLDDAAARALIDRHPELPWWPDAPGTIKLSAAWMIDARGWSGRSVGDAAVYERHALVLVNRGRARADHVLQLARCIRDDVMQHYGVLLEPEPVLVGGAL